MILDVVDSPRRWYSILKMCTQYLVAARFGDTTLTREFLRRSAQPSTGRGDGPKRLGVLPNTNDRVEVPEIIRALDPEVKDALWAAIEPLIPVSRRPPSARMSSTEASDRDCFEVILVRLVTGCSWEDAERLTGRVVSDTTAGPRRDEWIGAGVFDALSGEALAGFDSVSGSTSRSRGRRLGAQSPCGGEGTGKSPANGKLGWKWSIPPSARHPHWMGGRTRQPQRRPHARPDARRRRERGLLFEWDLWLDRGYDAALPAIGRTTPRRRQSPRWKGEATGAARS